MIWLHETVVLVVCVHAFKPKESGIQIRSGTYRHMDFYSSVCNSFGRQFVSNWMVMMGC